MAEKQGGDPNHFLSGECHQVLARILLSITSLLRLKTSSSRCATLSDKAIQSPNRDSSESTQICSWYNQFRTSQRVWSVDISIADRDTLTQMSDVNLVPADAVRHTV